MVICNYDEDIFYDGILQLKVIDNLLLILSKSLNRKIISIWDIETHELKFIQNVNNLTLTFSANKVSSDQITFIVPYGMRIFILKYSISSNALLTNGGFVFRQVSSNSNDIEIFDTAFTDDYYVFLYENNTNKNNAIGMQSSTFNTGSIVSEVCNNSSRIKVIL